MAMVERIQEKGQTESRAPEVRQRMEGAYGRMVYSYGIRVYMSLNIKNADVHRMARQLAKITGENMTEAIAQALRERLDRIRQRRQPDLAGSLVRIGKECAAHLKEPFRSAEHGELLYDENGLPK